MEYRLYQTIMNAARRSQSANGEDEGGKYESGGGAKNYAGVDTKVAKNPFKA